MNEKKYIVIVQGVQKFSNGDKVLSGGFVPKSISQNEIRDKLKRNLIAEFDPELSAQAQAANVEKVELAKELKDEIKRLQSENEDLKLEIETLKEEIQGLIENKEGVK